MISKRRCQFEQRGGFDTLCLRKTATDLVCGEENVDVLCVCPSLDLSPPPFVSFVTEDSQRRGEAATTGTTG